MNLVRGFPFRPAKGKFRLLFIVSCSLIATAIFSLSKSRYFVFLSSGELPFNASATNKILRSLENGSLKPDTQRLVILKQNDTRPYATAYITFDHEKISLVLLPSYRDHDTTSFGCYIHSEKPLVIFETPEDARNFVQAVGPARGATGHESQILRLKVDEKVPGDNWYHAFGHW